VRLADPMSTSPNDAHDEGAENKSVDELDANHTAEEAEAGKSTFLSRQLSHARAPVRNLVPVYRDVGRLGLT